MAKQLNDDYNVNQRISFLLKKYPNKTLEIKLLLCWSLIYGLTVKEKKRDESNKEPKDPCCWGLKGGDI